MKKLLLISKFKGKSKKSGACNGTRKEEVGGREGQSRGPVQLGRIDTGRMLKSIRTDGTLGSPLVRVNRDAPETWNLGQRSTRVRDTVELSFSKKGWPASRAKKRENQTVHFD